MCRDQGLPEGGASGDGAPHMRWVEVVMSVVVGVVVGVVVRVVVGVVVLMMPPLHPQTW